MTVYLCSGTVIDSSSVAISAFSTFGANAGNFGYQNLSDNFSVATSLPEGNYFLSVMVDSANAVAESNEANNISTFVPVTFIDPRADLSGSASPSYIFDVLYGNTFEAGQSVTFDVSL